MSGATTWAVADVAGRRQRQRTALEDLGAGHQVHRAADSRNPLADFECLLRFALDDQRDTHAAADAERRQATPRVAFLHLVQ